MFLHVELRDSVSQHCNHIHHRDEKISVLIQEMYHLDDNERHTNHFNETNLGLVVFVKDLSNDWRNFAQGKEEFHIDVSFLSIAK